MYNALCEYKGAEGNYLLCIILHRLFCVLPPRTHVYYRWRRHRVLLEPIGHREAHLDWRIFKVCSPMLELIYYVNLTYQPSSDAL